MRWIILVTFCLITITGCHGRVRLGSPQIIRATSPQITCIVVVSTDNKAHEEEIARAALNACKEAIDPEHHQIPETKVNHDF